ncbi:MAG: hypothetical protein JW947_00160, partial [Sedimentisphaerales bacterium]|nr:hypothetical protein [Sedimentisphaerales bacterium]
MKARILLIIEISVLFLAGCEAQTSYIDTMHDTGKPVIYLDYRDFDQAASEMVQSMLASGALKNPKGGRYVMATGHIANDTMQRIDTDQLMAKVEQELLNSGQVVMTSAVGSKIDQTTYDIRR